ncbi:MAG: glycosyltransferase [Pseudomonadales bacterium]
MARGRLDSVRHLLLLAYYFPPDGGAGAQRPAKFAKYLSNFGWKTTVVTRNEREVRGRYEPRDISLANELSDCNSIRIVRVPCESIGGIRDTGWISSVTDTCSKLNYEVGFDAIVATMSPFWMAEICVELKRRTGIPTVFDLRDPWVFDGWQRSRTYFHWIVEYRRMASALRLADGVVANTKESRKTFLGEIEHLESKSVTVIENGYDPEDFSDIENANEVNRDPDSYTLVFTGTLCTSLLKYDDGVKGKLKRLFSHSYEHIDYSGRTLIPLLAAVNLLRQRRKDAGLRFKLRCVGEYTDADVESVENAGLLDCVTFLGYQSHEQSISELMSADALFLPLHGLSSGRSLIVPGKTYEYLATNKPILACLPQGDARDLVMRSDKCFVSDPCDHEKIARALEDLYQFVTDQSIIASSIPAWLSEYSRYELTRKLSEFLDKSL